MASAMAQRRAGAHHQKLAQVAVAHLCDAPEPRFAAGRVLARRQAEEGSELTPAREGAGVLDCGHERADAVTGPTPGMVINRLAVSSALTDAASSLSIAPIASSTASIWPTSERRALRTQSGTTISPFSLKPSAAMRFRPEAGGAPCGAMRWISARWPRKALSAALRWPASSSRVRWRI